MSALKRISWDALKEFVEREETWERIERAARETQATHVVMFVNVQMDSRSFGHRTFLAVGPTCTYKTPQECAGKHLNDLPSQRGYPEAYAKVPKVII